MFSLKTLWSSLSNLANAVNDLAGVLRALSHEVRDRAGIEAEEGDAVLRLPDPDGATGRRGKK